VATTNEDPVEPAHTDYWEDVDHERIGPMCDLFDLFTFLNKSHD
jgi:hypothetical protein